MIILYLNLFLCHEGFCDRGTKINCGVDNIWWSTWCGLFWVCLCQGLLLLIYTIILAWGRHNKLSLTYCFFLQVCWHFCRFFMEKQVMGEFVRILRISRTVIVSLQLLQTMSIVIQNLKNEHSICKWTAEMCCTESIFLPLHILLVWHFSPNFADYMFSNEHINHLITYSFDFCNEELLSYYISFLRCVS